MSRVSRNKVKLNPKTLGTLLLAVGLWVGCKTSKEPDAGELTRLMKQQMNSARNQMQDAGASDADLRELDHAMQGLEDSMRQLEKELKRLERQMK